MNEIIYGDFLKESKHIDEKSMDLIILDPPYNVGAAKWDKIENYFGWLSNILIECHRILKENGSLYMWGMSKNNDFLKIKLFLDESNLFPKIEFKNWIVWVHEVKIHRKLKDRYLIKHEDLLFYANKNNTFNIVRDDPPEFQLKMHKGRYNENFFIERENLPPSQQKIFKNGLQMGSPAKSWWKGPSNQSNAKKYKKFAGYKSEWVCNRIIKVSSNKDDNILIPFGGIGTECCESIKLNRNFLSFEIDKERYNIIKSRINEITSLNDFFE